MTTGCFHGNVAIVTGAGGGIGEAIVYGLADAGAAVVAVDIDAPALEALERGAGDKALNVTVLPADVSRPAQAEAVVEEAEKRLGPVDFLVNCAGVLRVADALSLTAESWRLTFSVNVDGVFHMSSAVARRMAARGRGAIVTVGSNAGRVPRTHMAAYCASKAAAAAYTKTLGLELAGSGIRCNVVLPGSTDTPMLRSLWTDDTGPDGSLNGVPSEYRVGIPLRRLARASDIANAVEFLLSDRASHITMHELCVDGGASLGS
ncbi:2,3-dihydro-2,3-dihydroxybenzoate dehydrogenase [Sphaerisporangium sp. NPDC088356]|uniref:2,3-dihydro-2,3-dihydroxybenzoate dehydrogenase n=1 Tax=Sphaerisporangium sp. NPDC088356 TaxID=3154871 RepID=UPI00343FB042